MKVLYSQLKKYLPDLTATPAEVAEVYTMTGFMIDKLLEVEFNGKKDYLLDLEVRQNRADAFGVIGLARELSAYYNISINLPEEQELHVDNYELPIEVKSEKAVKRVMAIKLSNIKISESPQWLKDYLSFYEINSVNNLVDLTNYVMIETAHASHAFDTKLMGGDKLIWEINPGYKEITTLSGEQVQLSSDAIIISDGKRPLSLSIIGGKDVAINNNTDEVILEMSIYDGGLVRRNSREMRVITEASSRLEKYLDPDSIPYAFNLLVNQILEICGGTISSNIYDNYIQRDDELVIKLDLNKVQQIAGLEIPKSESKNYLQRLGFEIVSEEGDSLMVRRPLDRLDIEIEEDIFEEIIRLKGFNKIPKDKLTLTVNQDITPSHLNLITAIQKHLSSNGFDEVRSWVLVDSEKNEQANFIEWNEIKVTNSINEEVPFLRQSIGVSLIGQLENYLKNNIPDIKLFEIGKIFGKKGTRYSEINSLGMVSLGSDIDMLRLEVEELLNTIGLVGVLFEKSSKTPKTAHPKTSWDIVVNNQRVGIIYSANKNLVPESCITEIDIDLIDKLINKTDRKNAYEVTQKLVELDINIEVDKDVDVNKILLEKHNENIWKMRIVDEFEINGKTRYTVRVHYVNLTDPEAKELHKKIFES